jgi:hypothetical protein
LATTVFPETINTVELLHEPVYEFETGTLEEQRVILHTLHELSSWGEYTPLWYVAVCMYSRYVSDLLYSVRGSTLENLGSGYREIISLRAKVIQIKERAAMTPIHMYMHDMILFYAEGAIEMYQCLMSTTHQREKTKQLIETIREELMRKTWHPSRVQWWMDEEEKKEIFC